MPTTLSEWKTLTETCALRLVIADLIEPAEELLHVFRVSVIGDTVFRVRRRDVKCVQMTFLQQKETLPILLGVGFAGTKWRTKPHVCKSGSCSLICAFPPSSHRSLTTCTSSSALEISCESRSGQITSLQSGPTTSSIISARGWKLEFRYSAHHGKKPARSHPMIAETLNFSRHCRPK